MDRIDKRLFEFIKQHPRVVISEQAIRNAISEIRSRHPGLTLNAAASLFANNKGFKVMKYLNDKDRTTLQNIKISSTTTLSNIPKKTSAKKIKTIVISTPFGREFINDANENARIYPYVFILENSLRKLISDTFSSDQQWWQTKATTDAKNNAIRIQLAEKKHDWLPQRGNHPVYYVGLDDLLGIIVKNYPDFKHIFKDQGNLRTWINEVVPIRNLLAHNVKVNKEEQQNLMIKAKYICTLIESNRRLASTV